MLYMKIMRKIYKYCLIRETDDVAYNVCVYANRKGINSSLLILASFSLLISIIKILDQCISLITLGHLDTMKTFAY